MQSIRNLLLGLALALSACSTSASGGSAMPNMASRSVLVSIAVPRPLSTGDRVRPSYVSVNTQSLVIIASWWFPSQGQFGTYQPFITNTVNLNSCPVQNNTAYCGSNIAVPLAEPNGAALGQIGLGIVAYSGQNATGSVLSLLNPANSPSQASCQVPVQLGASNTCTAVLDGAVKSVTYSQTRPLIAGTPSSAAVAATFTDPSGATIIDSASGNGTVPTCLVDTTGDEFELAPATSFPFGPFADPHVTLVPPRPSNCGVGSSGSVGIGNSTEGANFEFNYDGAFEQPTPFTVQQISSADWSSGQNITFNLIVLPSASVRFATSSDVAQQVTLVPPPTFSGAVSLVIDRCLSASVTADGSANVSNLSQTPLMISFPDSAPSANGSPVVFTIKPAPNAKNGACFYHGSFDTTTEYGVTIGMSM